MNYNKTPLQTGFDVTHLIEISYRIIPREKITDIYKHNDNFWSMYYIDKGDASFETSKEIVSLKSGHGLFFQPNQIYRLYSTTVDLVHVICLFFDCPNLDRDFFANKNFAFNNFEREVLSNLIFFAKQNLERYSNLPNGPKGMRFKNNTPSFAPSFVKSSIEYLLFTLYQRKELATVETKRLKEQTNLLIKQAIEFMSLNLGNNLTLREIASHVNMSSSRFRALFKAETSQSVIDYYNELKIEQAKVLIRSNKYSYNEISSILGYNSESYFSRQFKQKTGMSPSEFSLLVNHDQQNQQ